MPDPAPAASDRYKGAVDTYRSIIRWLIASFGAIGAALVVGIQLTSLGQLHHTRLIAAIVVAAVGLLAVLAAIACAIPVLVPVSAAPEALKTDRRFAELRDLKGDDLDTLLRGMPAASIAQFVDLYVAELRKEGAARTELYAPPRASPREGELQKQIDDANQRLQLFAPVLSSLIGRGLYEHTRRTFHTATALMFVAAAIVGAASIAFALLTNPPKASAHVQATAQVLPLPTVRLVLFADGRAAVAPLLNRRCRKDLRGTIIGGTTASPVVLTLPRPGCRAVRVTVSGMMGRTVAAR